jgi:phosphoribosylaminoimidazole-succinocarboxamide synthase
VSAKGGIFLVDAIGPDELRILKDGVQLSKEFLRTFYRGTDWYGQVNQAKKQAKEQGVADWKRLVPQPPPKA